MGIWITFACGHEREWRDGEQRPVCTTCGETKRVRVSAPAPTFKGSVRGPLAQEQ